MRSASARRRRPCSSSSRVSCSSTHGCKSPRRPPGHAARVTLGVELKLQEHRHLRGPQPHQENSHLGHPTARHVHGPRSRRRRRTSCRDTSAISHGHHRLPRRAGRICRPTRRRPAATGPGSRPAVRCRGTFVRPVTSLHDRSGICGLFGQQDDSTDERACNETCNEICATNRANQPTRGQADRQVPRISWCPRQDSNLRRPA